MRQLFVMRHVEADSMKGDGGDIARKITPRGRAVADAARHHLVSSGFEPDAILSSSSERTRQTAQIVCGDFPTEISFTNRLYLATRDELVRLLREMDDDLKDVLLIGHNNGISDLVTYLSSAPCGLRTGAIAKLSCNSETWSGSFSRGLWNLNDSWHPG